MCEQVNDTAEIHYREATLRIVTHSELEKAKKKEKRLLISQREAFASEFKFWETCEKQIATLSHHQGCKIWYGNIIAHRNSIIVMAAAPPINYCNYGNYGKIGVSMVNSTKPLNKKLDFTSEKSSLYSKLLQLC